MAEACTAAVNLFVMVELFYLFSCRSLTGSMWRTGLLSNRWIVAGVSAQIAGQAALTYLPVMNQLFQTAPITWAAWLRILLLALAAFLIVAADQAADPPHPYRRPQPPRVIAGTQPLGLGTCPRDHRRSGPAIGRIGREPGAAAVRERAREEAQAGCRQSPPGGTAATTPGPKVPKWQSEVSWVSTQAWLD